VSNASQVFGQPDPARRINEKSPTVTEAASPSRRYNPWVALVVLCVGIFTILLDTTIVNIAVPSILSGLHASLDQVLWVLNAYILVYAVLLIPAGRLGDIFGPRRMFIAGVAIFTAASVVCGLTGDINQLIAARCVQGLGGAIMFPQTLTLLTEMFPEERRGTALGVWGGLSALAAIAGPTLGGWIITNWSWRWIFDINIPIGAVAIAGAFAFVPDIRTSVRSRLDPIGITLAGLGLLAVVFGLLEGQRYSWGAVSGIVSIPAVLAAGAFLLAGLVAWEVKQRDGLIPTSLFRSRNYVFGNLIGMAASFAPLGVFLPIVLLFQSILGLSALQTGIAMSPVFVGQLFAAPLAGKLSDRLGAKWFMVGGTALAAAGFGLVGHAAVPGATARDFIAPFVVMGFGLGLTSAPMVAVIMAGVSGELAGAASGFMTAARQLGATLGTAVIGAVLQQRLAANLHTEAVRYSQNLPEQLRAGFISGLSTALQGGHELGRGASQLQLPASLPPAVAHQLITAAHDTFVAAFFDSMPATFDVGVAVMVAACLGALALRNVRGGAKHAI